MQQVILVFHVLISIFIIALVLIQHGKGADIGASFGSGASQTVFGSQGSGSFLMKLTCGLGIVFFVTCLTLGYLVAHQNNNLFLPASAGPSPLTMPTPKQRADDLSNLPNAVQPNDHDNLGKVTVNKGSSEKK